MNIFLIILIIIVLIFSITALTGAPYVPSKKQELNEVFKKLYKLKVGDLLVDFGSGDGKVLRVAESFGAKAVGVEINPILVLLSRMRGQKVFLKDMFHFRFPKETTVVYLFGDSRDMKRIIRYLRNESKRLGKPLYLISLAFQADGLEGVKFIRKHDPYFLYKITG